MTDSQYISVRETAQILGTSEKKVMDLIEEGKLQAYKIANQFLRLKKSEIMALRNSGAVVKEVVVHPYTRADAEEDFFYFNDFYLISSSDIALLLFIIFQKCRTPHDQSVEDIFDGVDLRLADPGTRLRHNRDIKKDNPPERTAGGEKNNYLNLQRAIATNTIRTNGGPGAQKNLANPMTFLFQFQHQQLSNMGYQKVVENPGDKDWNPIRLYFESDKLISWKY